MKKEERKSTKNKEIMIMITLYHDKKKGVIKVNDGRKEIDEVRNEGTEPAITITVALDKKRMKIMEAPRRTRQRVAEKIGKQTRIREREKERSDTLSERKGDEPERRKKRGKKTVMQKAIKRN